MFNLHYLTFYNASLTFFFYSQPIDLLLGFFSLLLNSYRPKIYKSLDKLNILNTMYYVTILFFQQLKILY